MTRSEDRATKAKQTGNPAMFWRFLRRPWPEKVHMLSRNHRPVFLAEPADSRTDTWGYSASALYDFLAGRHFQWFAIEKRGTLRPQPRKEFFGKNLVAFPHERMPDATVVCDRRALFGVTGAAIQDLVGNLSQAHFFEL